MTDGAGLAFDGTLESFFFERIGKSLAARSTKLEPEIEAYAVHLLVSFARRRRVAGRTAPPLALQYMRAMETGPGALRDVGDRALSIAGIVPRSLARSMVDVRYVRSIGTSAYRGIASRVPGLAVFDGIAAQFETLELVLGDASSRDDEPEAHSDARGDLLGLYERWRRSRSKRDEVTLTEAGVRLDHDDDERMH